MEKLELKHICGYLPWGLQVEYNNRSCKMEVLYAETDEVYLRFENCIEGEIADICCIKPLLRPISSLREPLEDGSVPIVDIADLFLKPRKHKLLDGKAVSKYGYLEFEDSTKRFFERDGSGELFQPTHSFEMTEYLFQHHFDVYGLIDKGLAINLNEEK